MLVIYCKNTLNEDCSDEEFVLIDQNTISLFEYLQYTKIYASEFAGNTSRLLIISGISNSAVKVQFSIFYVDFLNTRNVLLVCQIFIDYMLQWIIYEIGIEHRNWFSVA